MLFNVCHSTFLPYYYKVFRRMRTFEKMVDGVMNASTLNERVKLARRAATWATFHATGYYASPQLEKVFLEAAETLPVVECKPIIGTVLHVMTRAYGSGGHTRVVERWISHSRKEERHSVVILNQGQEAIPKWLYVAVEGHNGEIVRLEEADVFRRANQLRQIASKYERIVLHVHMDDSVPIIAFGVESFTTPIIFFNHADHMFWLGVSIADMVVDFRQIQITQSRRDITNIFVLGLPCMQVFEKRTACGNKQRFRKELGIDDSDFVLVTTGTPFKYHRIGSNSLCKQLVEIIRREERIRCYAIGPDKDVDYWHWANVVSKGRILPLGVISDKEKYNKYLQSADLYIGSYPFSGGVASLDAVQCGLPIIQLIVTRQPNAIVSLVSLHSDYDDSDIVCHSTRELVEIVLSVSRNKRRYDRLLKASKCWAAEQSNLEEWKNRLYEMYSKCPQRHVIHPFMCKKGNQVLIDDNVCLLGFMYENDTFEIKRRFFRRLAHGWMRALGV